MARDRTILLDSSLTLKQAREIIESRGYKMSLRKTLNFYGLHYVEDRSFISRYREEFNLYRSSGRKIGDITLKELQLYRDLLIGHMVDKR